MFKFIKNKIMKFVEIFKDDNEYNEKNIIGFISFAIMVLTMVIDILTGAFGRSLAINEFIYNSFLIVTLGSFGISGLEKIVRVKNTVQRFNEPSSK